MGGRGWELVELAGLIIGGPLASTEVGQGTHETALDEAGGQPGCGGVNEGTLQIRLDGQAVGPFHDRKGPLAW